MYGSYGKCELRRVFQIDGIDGGTLNIAERLKEGRVLLVISNGDKEAQIALSKDDFAELAKLKDELRFSDPRFPAAVDAAA